MVVRMEGGGAAVPGGGSFAVAPPPGAFGNGLGVLTQPTLNNFAATQPSRPSMPIYTGTQFSHDRPLGGGGGPIEEGGQIIPEIKDATQLVLEFEAMSNKEKEKLARKLAMAGYLTGSGTLEDIVKGTTLNQLASAYESLLQEASGRLQSGQVVTPEQILETNIRYNLHRAGKNETLKEGSWWKALTDSQKPEEPELFTGVKKHTNVTRDIYSEEEAKSLARATLQNALGRDPTRAEYEDFVAALQTEQRENPVRTVTRDRYKEGELVRSTTNSHGGVDVQQFAYDQAREQPGYAEWQAVGTYLPQVFADLGAGISGV